MSSIGSTTPRVILAVLVALAAGFAGFYLSRARSTADDSTTLTPTAVVPQQPAAQPATAKKAIPETLPDVTLADRDGKPTRLASFGGRPLMVNFWATWCAPCRREIPLLNALKKQRKAQNVEIVGIAVDFREDVLKFVTEVPLNYALLIGEEDGLAAAEAFGMGMAFPFSAFVDSQNRILAMKLGELHEDEANFAFDRILDVDNGRMNLTEARAAIAEAFAQLAAERARKEADSHPEKSREHDAEDE